MANNDIIELLDILYGMVNEAWSVPLGNDKCIIEREKAIEIINEIKVNLPPPSLRLSALSLQEMSLSAMPSVRLRQCVRTPKSRPAL